MQILISGSTGFVGSALIPHLTRAGHTVVRLVRAKSGMPGVVWNPAADQIEADRLNGIDAVVHLAGESIASGRWTATKKEQLVSSRVRGTALLAGSVAKLSRPPKVFVSASAVGYYGDRGSEVLHEDSLPGKGFLADVCKQWEAATAAAERKGIRVVRLRFGVVIAWNGGVLAKLSVPFKLGIGGKVGPGTQYMSWISLQDLCRAIQFVLENSAVSGPVNTVSPNPVTNLEFTKTLGRVLSRPTIFPLPAFAARLAFGQMADELLLSSTRVEPRKLLASGFSFQHPTLESSLR